MNETDPRELKKAGMIPQAGKGLFSVRLHVTGGNLGTKQLDAIREAADRFGQGWVHLTIRQGVEIHHVPLDSLTALKEFLAPSGIAVGGAGPTVRTVTACPGCGVCTRGVIDSPSVARAIDRRLYGKPAPHKFKIGVSGCPNNCIKAEENDAGIKGWIEPRVAGPSCAPCKSCQASCPVDAIRVSDEGAPNIDMAACIGCGDCIPACPSGCIVEHRRGYVVFAGGKMGRVPILGKRVSGVLATEEEAVAAIVSLLEFFREHGKPRERFAATVRRVGFPAPR
ncbi:MAG: 4Fe-4S binding protein [Deltaproteobacteria bacterium]|nr:4Fe-4S binding protein [Deltaproteobacteria bacterium]